MSGLTQLVNWTSVTTTVGMSRLDHTGLAGIGEDGTVTSGTIEDGWQSYIRPYVQRELVDLGLIVIEDNTPIFQRNLRVFVEWESDKAFKMLQGMSEIWSSGIMHCYKITGPWVAFWMASNQTVTFHRFGVFDAATWDTLLAAWQAGALQRPWFNHATMPDPRG